MQNNSRSTIDLVLINNADLRANVLDEPNITDHSIVEMNILEMTEKETTIEIRDRNINLNLFTKSLLALQ